jgi:uncharacterized membrane protein
MDRSTPASTRLAVGAAVGVAVAVVTGVMLDWGYAATLGYDVGALLFVGSTWAAVGRMDAVSTAAHATREDPGARQTRVLVLAASVASLGAVGVLLVRAGSDQGAGRAAVAALGVASVAVSWVVVHTLFTLHYARLYYGPGGGDPRGPGSGPAGGIDFGLPEAPRYPDFGYLAFTVGMTYQLSDTPLTSRALRSSVLRHALLSYLFGSLILGASVNLVVSLAS